MWLFDHPVYLCFLIDSTVQSGNKYYLKTVSVRSEVIAAVKTLTLIFWAVMVCGIANGVPTLQRRGIGIQAVFVT